MSGSSKLFLLLTALLLIVLVKARSFDDFIHSDSDLEPYNAKNFHQRIQKREAIYEDEFEPALDDLEEIVGDVVEEEHERVVRKAEEPDLVEDEDEDHFSLDWLPQNIRQFHNW